LHSKRAPTAWGRQAETHVARLLRSAELSSAEPLVVPVAIAAVAGSGRCWPSNPPWRLRWASPYQRRRDPNR